MISPDAANLGIKAVYVWAGLLVPFTILLWLYYPEVSQRVISAIMHLLTFSRHMAVLTGNSTNSTSARSPPGSSRTPLLLPTRVAARTLLSCPRVLSRRSRWSLEF
jgi:hypothetical protein